MTAGRHARRGPLARLAALLRADPDRPRIIRVGMPGYTEPMLYRPRPAPGEKQWERLAGDTEMTS
jgi:hypothetical protein